MSSLKSRVLVAVVGVPVLLWVVLWAPVYVVSIALALLSAIGAYELMKCVGAYSPWRLSTAVLACFVVLATELLPWPEGMSVTTVLSAVLFVCFAVAVFKAGEIKFLDIAAVFLSATAIPYAFSAFLRIEAMGLHRAWLLLPFILSFACDTFAYFVGCTIGKHKLAPKVSPKKSVEGSIGGLAGNVLCGCLFAFVMNRWFGESIGYGTMVILALLCGVVAQIGDLSFSLIKREFGIKDYGKLFLAHGGVLDRFDSVLFVAPVIEIVLNLVK